MGICPKVNVIARLEYELAYYDSAVHRFNHYTTRTPPREYIGFGLVGFYGILNFVGFLMLNLLYKHISIYIYIYIYIWFGLLGVYGISTILGFLMPNSLYTYLLDLYEQDMWDKVGKVRANSWVMFFTQTSKCWTTSQNLSTTSLYVHRM